MHRATLSQVAFRAYSGGGSRSVVSSVDDSSQMQSMAGGIMAGEQRQGVEAPQNYGFTSVTMDSSEGEGGKMEGAETFVSFMGGNRSFPVAGNIDDRRHRLTGLDKGDSAQFTTKGRKQQFHLSKDGGFWTAPQDKTMRMALLDEDSEQDQQGTGQLPSQGAGGGSASAAAAAFAVAPEAVKASVAKLTSDWWRRHGRAFGLPAPMDAGGGGGGGAGGSSGGQQGQQRGQKSLKDKNQKAGRFIDVAKDQTRCAGKIVQLIMAQNKGGGSSGGGGGGSRDTGSSGGGSSGGSSQQDSGTVLAEASKDSKFYCGGTPKKGKYALIVTVKGPTINVPGRIG